MSAETPALLEGVNLVRRFAGLDRLLGSDPAQRVRNAHIMVVGIGGVGSWTAEALARSGVGRITLVDMDHISESNINRQLHALTDTVGRTRPVDMHLYHEVAEIFFG